MRSMTQLLYELKTLLINQMDDSKGRMEDTSFFEKFVLEICDAFYADEVTYFKLDYGRQYLHIEASTERYLERRYIPLGSCAVFNDGEPYYYKDFQVEALKDFQLYLPLKRENEIVGLLALKEGIPGSFEQITSEEGEAFSKEVMKILNAAIYMSEITSERRRYKQLFRVTEKFHSSMSMDAVLGEIISTLQEVYPSFTYFLLLSHDNANHENLPIKDLGYDSENVAVMQAYVTGTVQIEDEWTARKTNLYAPLKGKQGVYGVLQVIAPNARMFSEKEVEFISLLANTAGGAFENAQLYQQSRRLISDLQLINETSHKLNLNLRLSETMEFMKEQIIDSFHADEAGFVYILPDGTANFLTGSTEFFHSDRSGLYVDFLKEKICSTMESLFIGDLHLKIPNKDVKYRSMMAVPMMESDQVHGFALVLHKDPYYFSFDTFKLLQSLIYHTSLALANSMLREELEKMVITDHLTGLYSRSYLDAKMLESTEKDDEGTFILVDIDDFKKVNDTHGHQIGDDILIQVSMIIQSSIRETDIGARWGGEELAIYLPNVSIHVGQGIAQRIQEKVSEQTEPKVTISCGVSYWMKGHNDHVKALFKRADDALYVAKNTGKNKVLVQD
ncbi:diguanylate cyclase domain-containing protein [Peribacillus loiseleuriae]|uniref:sensor domain-containing diguanylate cyclase n=1 Tax=Peribacillus loiseleuriae TaxID=1679170 RepID=UPI0037FDBB94